MGFESLGLGLASLGGMASSEEVVIGRVEAAIDLDVLALGDDFCLSAELFLSGGAGMPPAIPYVA